MKDKEFDSLQLGYISQGWSTITPTMHLRWLETNEYDQNNDCLFKVLQQKWISDTGKQEWRDIETFKKY